MATGEQMRLHLPGWIILMLSGICFADALHLGSGVWDNPLADAWSRAMDSVVLAIIFFLHGLNTGPRRADVVSAACLVTGLKVADNHGLLSNQYNTFWLVLIVLAFIVYFRGSWIESRRQK